MKVLNVFGLFALSDSTAGRVTHLHRPNTLHSVLCENSFSLQKEPKSSALGCDSNNLVNLCMTKTDLI